MSFEALTCTYCGSGDVKEVKPDTYFCDHCERVFKHIAPTRLAVSPSFCDHGNPVDVQCQVCKAGMCSQRCDVVAVWAAHKHAGIIQTRGFGYLEHHRSYDAAVEGPFLSVAKLLASLALDCGGLSHACYACVSAAVPATAERIASGAICQTIRCWFAATGHCPCCNGGFCKNCSMPEAADGQGYDGRIRGVPFGHIPASGIAISVRNLADDRPIKNYFTDWQAPDGMCKPCAGEYALRAAAMASTICRQDYAGRLTAVGDGMFKIPAVQVRRKRQQEEVQRQHQAAAQYAAEISARVKELVAIDRSCDRSNLRARSTIADINYAIVDERGHVNPVAVSEVIWANPGEWSLIPQ
jgi:hypothetical protein